MGRGATGIEQKAPGQHGRERAGVLSAWLIGTIGLAVVVLLVAWKEFGGRGWTLALIEVAAIGLMVAAQRVLEPQIGRWLQGARGEERVGAVLGGLESQGWSAIHGIFLGRGDVDHVVIGPGGVFAIETKSHRGRIPVERIEERMLRQAYAEAKRIERITTLRVEPLLVFSAAWLVGSVPARRQGVTVLPARMLDGYLKRRRPTMSTEEARRVAERLTGAVSTLDRI